MSTWTALNIVPDSDSEGEVDNTEEIQIEEALKLYQRALKLHGDGELEEAKKAYEDLFKSEIFQRDTADLEEDLEEHSRDRTAASSLPLAHYLAFKNRGRFNLDRLKNRIGSITQDDLQEEVSQTLGWFSTALCRDAGDPSLWREAAQLASVLRSERLARFALESVLDHSTVGVDASRDILSLVSGGVPNPEDHVSLVQLRKMLEQLGDTDSLENPVIQQYRKKKVGNMFKKLMKPYPWLPTPPPDNHKHLLEDIDNFSKSGDSIQVDSRSWTSVGKALLAQIPQDDGTFDAEDVPATSGIINIVIPPGDSDQDSRDTTPDEESATAKSEPPVADDTDVPMADGTVASLIASNDSDRRRSGSGNRKRKSTSMGVDTAGSRLSKRQRDKKEADAAAAAAAASTPESKAKIRNEAADEKLFNTIDDLFSPFGLTLGTAESLRISATAEEGDASMAGKKDLYIEDFKALLQQWDDKKGNVILYGDGIQSTAEIAQSMRFMELEASATTKPALPDDEGLRRWVKDVNSQSLSAEEAAVEWLKALTRRDTSSRKTSKRNCSKSKSSSEQSLWIKYQWPDALRNAVMDVADISEDTLWERFKDIEGDINDRMELDPEAVFTDDNYADLEWAETLLEVYLDDVATIERAQGDGDKAVDVVDELETKKERISRWGCLVGDLMNFRSRDNEGSLEEDPLTLRFLWAKVLIIGFRDPSREDRLAFFADLQESLAGRPVVELPNSHIMPEVSASMAEREISKLKTASFFNTIFATSDANKDPEDTIDILEAVLKPGEVIPYDDEEDRMLKEIGHFLDGSTAMFKLYLWGNLKTAYTATGQNSRILSCTMKCIHILMAELTCRNYMDSSQDHRGFVLLRALRILDGMIVNALKSIQSDRKCLDELTNDEALDALSSMLKLLRPLHCFALWEGSVLKAEVKASDLHSYRLVQVKFRELLVRSWVTVYYLFADLLKRGLGSEGRQPMDEEEQSVKLMGFLRDLHEELGPRHYCKLANHVFLKLMFDEFVRFDSRDFESEFLQCIRCRFHLVLCSDQWHFDDHKTDPEPLTKGIGMKLLDFVLALAADKKPHQLAKSGIGMALDKLVDVVGVPKRAAHGKIFHNDAVINQYWKSSINPLRLYDSLRGGLSISTLQVSGEYKEIASKGLYSLQGKIAMHPLKSSKRNAPLRPEDMKTALDYFKHDLVCKPESWETWYRIAQMNEMMMEEEMTWTADAVNSERPKLVELERISILSYMMATSCAIQDADSSPETLKCVAEMFTDFGYRIYSASRPPMARESFWVDDFERRYSGTRGEGMYTGRPHSELSEEAAWRTALQLFQNAIDRGGDDNWKNYYMMGKCMNKLYNSQADFGGEKFTPEQVLDKYAEAVTRCPDKVNNEYIFEPHHKLISSAIKFVLGPFSTKENKSPPPPEATLTPQRACEILDASHFTKKIPHATDRDSFIKYSIEVIKKMKALDKSRWHHRMTNRLANIYEQHCSDIPAAKAEMSTLFSSKSGTLNIWKPDNERRGRHYYYASNYIYFYARLCEQTQDRATLELLAKRVRKNANGLFRHSDVWTSVYQAYMRTLRKYGSIPHNHDEEVFTNVSIDEFAIYSAKLDAWCVSTTKPSTTTRAVKILDLLREVFELRKLNAALIKTAAIEDLLIDVYARLYEEVVSELRKLEEIKKEKAANPMNLKNLMFDSPPVEKGKPGGEIESQVQIFGKKITKVSRRELISKASGICKELSAPVQQTTATSGLNVRPNSTIVASAGSAPGGQTLLSSNIHPMVLLGASRPRSPEDRMQVDQEDGDDEQTDDDDEPVTSSTRMEIDD
ncbi:hypothetical protein EX30DRAFT_317948 [Ascodesmis nigricans]|uniref:Histone transcription regulator 3 homolog n=1 Tax=Ascodesmis nigricans TaxID=341454 RepID=A0A4S2N0H3_9PEZI|nr:hypothetical protein EX30DRAFT_317948 [Ascodesmis nigricans]